MDYKELFIAIGLMVVVTIIYLLIRKFIHWTIEDSDKFHKRNGRFGYDKEDKKAISDMPMFKLNSVYILIMLLLILYIIKLLISL